MAQPCFFCCVQSTPLGPSFLLSLRTLLKLLFQELMLLIVLVILFSQLNLDCSNCFFRLFLQRPKLFLRFCWVFRVCSFTVVYIFCPNCRLLQWFTNDSPLVTYFAQLTSITFGFELSYFADCVRDLPALYKALDVSKVVHSWVFWWCGAEQHDKRYLDHKNHIIFEILSQTFRTWAHSVSWARSWQTRAYCRQGWGFYRAQEDTQNHRPLRTRT